MHGFNPLLPAQSGVCNPLTTTVLLSRLPPGPTAIVCTLSFGPDPSMTIMDLAAYRNFFAEEVQLAAGLESEPLVRAFATVPRERFLDPGPWRVLKMEMDGRGFGYRATPDADPRHLYHNVAVSIDPARDLSNGHPGTLAAWLQWLGLREGARVVHLGCGPGYYTAIIAETVGPHGPVVAIEIDAGLAAKASRNLAPWTNVDVRHGDGSTLDGPVDAIFVNAGVTHALDAWLDALADAGAMLLPIGVEMPPVTPVKGVTVRIERRGERYRAQYGSMMMIYPCAIARDPAMNQRAGAALRDFSGMKIRSLRRDAHTPDGTCWLHRDGSCLSFAEPG
jgi:protein-L-isoaspartate(D-aspartate) O-methyltransferase